LPAVSTSLKLFKSHEPNTFHRVTSVCYRRVPVFRSAYACDLFVDILAETRRRLPFKLIGYVVMPDHAHLILNPLGCDISKVMNSMKSASDRKIIDWLRDFNHTSSLRKLELDVPKKRGHTHAVWQRDFSSVDLWSPKFIGQKLNYTHLNPVRAGLCEHPAGWKWSSYRAYLPHEPGSVPLEMDWRGIGKTKNLNREVQRRAVPASKREGIQIGAYPRGSEARFRSRLIVQFPRKPIPHRRRLCAGRVIARPDNYALARLTGCDSAMKHLPSLNRYQIARSALHRFRFGKFQ